MTKTATTTAGIAAVAFLLAACGTDDGGDGGSEAAPPSTLEEVGGDLEKFEAYLGALPGVEEATAEEVELDTDYYGWDAEIVLTADADPSAVRDTFAAAAAFDEASDYGEEGSVYISRSGTDHSVSWHFGPAERTPEELADMFALGEERMSDLPWRLDEYGQFLLSDLPDLDAITALAERVAADAQLAEHDSWAFSTDFDLTGNEGSHGLEATNGLSASTVDAWREVVAAVETLDQVVLDNLHLTSNLSPDNDVSDPPPNGRIHLGFEVDTEARSRAELETGVIGQELHRFVEATVPVLAGYAHGCGYSIHTWVGQDNDVEPIDLVRIESDEKDHGRSDGTIAGHARALLDELD